MNFYLKQRSIQAVIFDMDGTMIDNMMIHHQAWQKQLASLGIKLPLDEVKARIHGVNEEILKREFGNRFSPEERRQIAWDKEAAYRRIYKDQLELIKGLPAFLDQLDTYQIPYGIGTAAPGENADFVVDELNIRSRFKTIVHAGHVQKGKPDPQVFELVAKGMGVPIQDCLIFEDSPTGAEAAERAGASSIILMTTHQPKEFAHFSSVFKTIPDFTHLKWNGDIENLHLI